MTFLWYDDKERTTRWHNGKDSNFHWGAIPFYGVSTPSTTQSPTRRPEYNNFWRNYRKLFGQTVHAFPYTWISASIPFTFNTVCHTRRVWSLLTQSPHPKIVWFSSLLLHAQPITSKLSKSAGKTITVLPYYKMFLNHLYQIQKLAAFSFWAP